MSTSRDRSNKSATTFWMDNDLKKKAQEKARFLGMTLTDIINRSVEIYLVKGADLEEDEEWQKKLAAANISSSIKESGLSYEKIEKIDEAVASLTARLKVLEENTAMNIDKTNKIDTEMKKQVQKEVFNRVSPILESLYKKIGEI